MATDSLRIFKLLENLSRGRISPKVSVLVKYLMKPILLCYELDRGKEKIISQNSWFRLTIYPILSFSKIFYNSVLSDQTINYLCPKLILIFHEISPPPPSFFCHLSSISEI
jgi:hypothetical protein